MAPIRAGPAPSLVATTVVRGTWASPATAVKFTTVALQEAATRKRRVKAGAFRVARHDLLLETGARVGLEEVGQSFQVTRERIRQIEAKALRKLRHPSPSRKLKAFLEGSRI